MFVFRAPETEPDPLKRLIRSYMIINTEITFTEYRNLLFGLTYRKPIMKVIIGVALAMIVWISGFYLKFLPVPEPKIYQYITLGLITVVQPCAIYWTIKQNFQSSTHLGQDTKIDLTKEQIKINGESIYMEIQWNSIFKVVETKSCFLIYQNSLSAVIIPKKDFPSSQHQELRTLFSEIPDLPLYLKKGHMNAGVK